MALHNINTLQNIKDLETLSTLTNEYVLQSLANLGQRFAPEGKSIAANDFKFKDILSFNNKESLNTNSKGVIEYSPSLGCKFYYVNIPTNLTELSTLTKLNESEWYNNLTRIEINEDEEIRALEKNEYLKQKYWISKIAYENFIENTENFYNLSFFYKGIESTEDNPYYKEYCFEQFNKIDNTLNDAIRIFYTYDDYNRKTLNIYRMYQSSVDEYKLQIYSAKDDELSITDANHLLYYGPYTGTANKLIEYLEQYLEIEDEDNYDLFIEYLVEEFSDFLELSGEEYDVEYDTNNSMYFYIDNDDINEYLNYFTYDIVYQYKFALDYYYDNVYSNETSVRKALLQKIASVIYNDANVSSIDSLKIYLPLDYNFKYFTDTSGEGNDKIYINALPVTCEFADKYYSDYYTFINCKTLLTISTLANQLRQYNYSVKYVDSLINQSVTKNYIDSFYCECFNILPYIQDNKWFINGNETVLNSKGDDAGKPNIILYYSNKINSKPQLLSASYKEELESIGFLDSFINTNVTVQTPSIIDSDVDFVEGYHDEEITVTAKAPTLNSVITTNSKYMSLLENSLLINITPIENLVDAYSYTYVTEERKVIDFATYNYDVQGILADYINDINNINNQSNKNGDFFQDSSFNWKSFHFTQNNLNWKVNSETGRSLYYDFVNNFCDRTPILDADNEPIYTDTDIYTSGLVDPDLNSNWQPSPNYGYAFSYMLKNNAEKNASYNIVLSNNTWTIVQEVYPEVSIQHINKYDDPVTIDNSYIYQKYSYSGLITTVWSLSYELTQNQSDGQYIYTYVYKPVKHPLKDNFALDINAMSSINHLLTYQIKYGTLYPEPDNSLYDQLTFDNCYIALKQTDDEKFKIYPNIINLDAVSQSMTTKGVNNNCNLTVRYSAYMNYNTHRKTIEGFSQFVPGLSNSIYWIANIDKNTNIYEPFSTKTFTGSQVQAYPSDTVNYTFNADIPTFNLAEVITTNQNLLNRTNIISLDKNGVIYNSYLGTSFDWEDKDCLVLGSSTKNINIGTDTLLNSKNNGNFRKNTKFYVQFDNLIQTNTTNMFTYNVFSYIEASKELCNNSYTTNHQNIKNYHDIDNYEKYNGEVSYIWSHENTVIQNDGFTYINNTIEFTDNSLEICNAYTYEYQSVISYAVNTHHNDIITTNNDNLWTEHISINTNNYYYSTNITPICDLNTVKYDSTCFDINDNNTFTFYTQQDDGRYIDGFTYNIFGNNLTLIKTDTLIKSIIDTKHPQWSNVLGNYKIYTNNDIITSTDSYQYFKVNSQVVEIIKDNTYSDVILPQLSITYWYIDNTYNFKIEELTQTSWRYPGIINIEDNLRPTSPTETPKPIVTVIPTENVTVTPTTLKEYIVVSEYGMVIGEYERLDQAKIIADINNGYIMYKNKRIYPETTTTREPVASTSNIPTSSIQPSVQPN